MYIFDDIIEIAKEVEKGYLPIFTYKTANNTKMEEEPTFPETSIELPPNVLYSPVIDTITKGKKYTFKIKCKSARKMQIFDGNNFFDLTEKEKIFSGEFLISNEANQIVIFGYLDDTDDTTIFYSYKLS